MFKRKLFWVCVLVPLYAVTWVGGWISHAQQLQDQAEASYRRAERENQDEEALAQQIGVKPYLTRLHPDGPKTGVLWCVAVVPGILLTYSHSSIGPLGGRGGIKIVLYYGFGSQELCMLYGWLA